MANTNSNIVAQRYTAPMTKESSGQNGGRLRVVGGNFEVAAADIDAGDDTIRLAILPANARIWQIWIGGDDLDTSTDLDYDIGLYEPGTASTGPGTVIDDDCFASAITQQAVRDLGGANLITEALATASALWTNFGERLWEVAGDTQGAFDEYEVVATLNGASASAVAGTVAFCIVYSVD